MAYRQRFAVLHRHGSQYGLSRHSLLAVLALVVLVGLQQEHQFRRLLGHIERHRLGKQRLVVIVVQDHRRGQFRLIEQQQSKHCVVVSIVQNTQSTKTRIKPRLPRDGA